MKKTTFKLLRFVKLVKLAELVKFTKNQMDEIYKIHTQFKFGQISN